MTMMMMMMMSNRLAFAIIAIALVCCYCPAAGRKLNNKVEDAVQNPTPLPPYYNEECGEKKGCEDCLDFGDAYCAFFVRGKFTQCIDKKRCTDKGFEGGYCFKGDDDGDGSAKKDNNDNNSNKSICKNTKCNGLKGCNKCLNFNKKKGANCTWFVQGKYQTCIAAERCDDVEFEGGDCIEGAVESEKKGNKAICKGTKKKRKRKKKKKPSNNDPDKPCEDRSGSCGNCLKNGCFWVPETKDCLSSCEFGPQDDARCVGTTPPVVIETEPSIIIINQDDLTIAKHRFFDSEASMMCAEFDLEESNRKLCQKAGKDDDCKSCRDTHLKTLPGIYYFIPPTCEWFPPNANENENEIDPFVAVESGGSGGGGFCTNKKCNFSNCAVDTCPDLPPIVLLPPEGTTWPNLVGKDVKVAKSFLEDTYGKGTLDIQIVIEGNPVTCDYRLDRVRLVVVVKDTESTIVEVPGIG